MKKTIKTKRFLIAKGNSTLLVWGCPPSDKKEIIEKNLGQVEQIGFIEVKNRLPFLNMMGGELCINGTVALASLYGKTGTLFTSGLDFPVAYKNERGVTTIKLKLNYKKVRNIILFEGIGFIYLEKKKGNIKEYLKKLSKKYSQPAFGVILFRNKKLIPYVYVVGTDSLFKETACGSGSIALYLLKRIQNVTQPTGEVIKIKKQNNTVILSAKVESY